MKIIVTALHIEARPLIDLFGLKKNAQSKKLPVYENDDCTLIVSGTGQVASAIATTQLLATIKQEVKESIHCFNVGLCGCSNKDLKAGESFLINKIHQQSTGRDYYPDVLVKHTLNEGSATTVDVPLTVDGLAKIDSTSELFEMEATGFFQAAATFLAPHQIHTLKTISDHLEGGALDKARIKSLLNTAGEQFKEYIESCNALPQAQALVFPLKTQVLLETLIKTLRLTETQSHQLKDAAKVCLFNNKDELETILSAYANNSPKHKSERALIMSKMIEALTNA